jgi:adenylylsulfate kinase
MSLNILKPKLLVFRSKKEKLLHQKGLAVWLTGLSGAGKSTIAIHLEKKLNHAGIFTKVLDGDDLRHGINSDLDFSETGRMENIRRIAEIAKLDVRSGIISIVSAITPKEQMRMLARKIIGKADFFLAYIDCPIDICEQRDVKGLYKKARAGKIKNFTGISSGYETPTDDSINIHLTTYNHSLQECVNAIFDLVYKRSNHTEFL